MWKQMGAGTSLNTECDSNWPEEKQRGTAPSGPDIACGKTDLSSSRVSQKSFGLKFDFLKYVFVYENQEVVYTPPPKHFGLLTALKQHEYLIFQLYVFIFHIFWFSNLPGFLSFYFF